MLCHWNLSPGILGGWFQSEIYDGFFFVEEFFPNKSRPESPSGCGTKGRGSHWPKHTPWDFAWRSSCSRGPLRRDEKAEEENHQNLQHSSKRIKKEKLKISIFEDSLFRLSWRAPLATMKFAGQAFLLSVSCFTLLIVKVLENGAPIWHFWGWETRIFTGIMTGITFHF